MIWPNQKLYNTWGALGLKDWYRDVRKETQAPTGKDMLINMFGVHKATIIFKDNSQVNVVYGEDGVKVEEYIDVCENGDWVNFDWWGRINGLSIRNPNIYDNKTGYSSELGDVQRVGQLAYGKVEHDGDYSVLGRVIMSDGRTFSGNFVVWTTGERRDYTPRSQHLRALCDNNFEDFKNMFPAYGIDNVRGIKLYTGTLVSKDNKVMAMYDSYKELDDLDMAAELAAEQGRIDREKATAQKAAKEKTVITKKYGKKYADAFFAGNVIVGMPWSLVEIGLNAHSFKSFYTALFSFERQSGSGKKECYTLIGDNLTDVGHMWIVNGKVESISFY